MLDVLIEEPPLRSCLTSLHAANPGSQDETNVDEADVIVCTVEGACARVSSQHPVTIWLTESGGSGALPGRGSGASPVTSKRPTCSRGVGAAAHDRGRASACSMICGPSFRGLFAAQSIVCFTTVPAGAGASHQKPAKVMGSVCAPEIVRRLILWVCPCRPPRRSRRSRSGGAAWRNGVQYAELFVSVSAHASITLYPTRGSLSPEYSANRHPSQQHQGWPTNLTGTVADLEGGITGIGVNQTLPVPAHGNVSDVCSGWGAS